MEISNLTLGRENRRIFQKKLLLPWVKSVSQAKEKKKKKKSINQRLKKSKRKENKKRGSLDQTMSEQCAELSKLKQKISIKSNQSKTSDPLVSFDITCWGC